VNVFNLPNISSRTMALGSTQPLTEMSTTDLPGVKGRPALKADNLTVGVSTSHRPMSFHGLLQGYLYFYLSSTINKNKINTMFLNILTLCRKPSSGILRRVFLVRTDVSEERIASIIRASESR
jgi:hypothetical protein